MTEKERHRNLSKILVIVAVAGAVCFGGYIGYLAWVNDSFPSEQKPFADYAAVAATNFNGTELSIDVRWLNSSYTPLYVQITSSTDDPANSPVCDLQLSSVQSGQVIHMPFGTTAPAASLSNVELWIAVRGVRGTGDFSVVYDLPGVAAVPGNLYPTGIACAQSAASL